jgi:hypothetical protein
MSREVDSERASRFPGDGGPAERAGRGRHREEWAERGGEQ